MIKNILVTLLFTLGILHAMGDNINYDDKFDQEENREVNRGLDNRLDNITLKSLFFKRKMGRIYL